MFTFYQYFKTIYSQIRCFIALTGKNGKILVVHVWEFKLRVETIYTDHGTEKYFIPNFLVSVKVKKFRFSLYFF